MTSLVMTRARRPATAMGTGTSTVASRLTSPRKTSSTCSLAVASHPVSPPPPSPQPGLTRWWWETGCQPLPFPAAPPDSAPLTVGNVHVYSNGRMRYNYQQRQDRRENQGDVSEEGAGSGGEGGLEGQRQAQPSILGGSGPTASAEEPSWASLAILLSDTRGSHTPRCPEEWAFDGLIWRM